MYNEAIYNAPLYEALERYNQQNLSRFHTPGHKAAPISPFYKVFGSALQFDVTELPQTDSLFDADGAIYQAEIAAAAHFGVKHTLFSAGGASLCIQAMMRLAQKRGNNIICARNIHRSAVNAMSLLGMNPVWVYPRQFDNSDLPGFISAQDIESQLTVHPDTSAVFITSPDYYGIMSDIKGIAQTCKKYGVPLLVDNAHGSHLFYIGDGSLHPSRLGASITCDSAHKTLPVLTGGAFLQINSEQFTYSEAKAAMSLFASTSPSYLILLSLDLARSWLEQNGKTAYHELCEKVNNIKTLCIQKGFVFARNASFDPARLTLDFSSVGYSGQQAEQMLLKSGISSEMHDNSHVVFIPTPFNKRTDFERLENFIINLKIRRPIQSLNVKYSELKTVMSLKEAVFAQSELVPIEQAVQRVAAECRIPCPPGIPVIMPGELISHESVNNIKNYGIFYIKVVK